MKNFARLLVFFVVLCFFARVASAHGAHEHGVLLANVFVEGGSVSITMESPLANFLPFERSPATLKEAALVRAMAEKMRLPQSLFLFSEKAECTLKKVSMASPVLDPRLLAADAPEKPVLAKADPSQGGHADIDISAEYECREPEELRELKSVIFHNFPAIHTIRLQMILPDGQRSAELTPKANTVGW
ncbi:MAG: DUF2796 domain-containing protein [Desulfovibrionaceae bacterium]|nr:DUF2796 domain-containing protein [Desulfovibrionaceae bacterium]